MSDRNARHRSSDAPTTARGGRRRLRIAGALFGVVLVVMAGVFVARAQSEQPSNTPNAGADRSVAVSSSAVTPSPEASGSLSASPSLSPTPSKIAASTLSPSATASAAASASAASTVSTSSGSSVTAPAGWRTLTMVNRLSYPIWPAIAADPNHPISATGWVLAPGASLTILIPDHWDVRMWARTGCSFNSAGVGSCVTSGCGKLQCGSTWGEFPSTLAEFNLNAWDGMDFYDVSLVEGNNLPMWVNSWGGSSTDKINDDGCSAAGCTQNANTMCPSQLQRVVGGQVVACLSACLVFNTAQTCCSGAYAPRADCNPTTWPVDSAAVFKKAEPFAYSYVDDDATSVLTCTGECDYRVTWGVSP